MRGVCLMHVVSELLKVRDGVDSAHLISPVTFNLDRYLFLMQTRALNQRTMSFNTRREMAQFSHWVMSQNSSIVTCESAVSFHLPACQLRQDHSQTDFNLYNIFFSPLHACVQFPKYVCYIGKETHFLFITQIVNKVCFYIHCEWQPFQFEKSFQHYPSITTKPRVKWNIVMLWSHMSTVLWTGLRYIVYNLSYLLHISKFCAQLFCSQLLLVYPLLLSGCVIQCVHMAEGDTFITSVQRPACRPVIDGSPTVQKPTIQSHGICFSLI